VLFLKWWKALALDLIDHRGGLENEFRVKRSGKNNGKGQIRASGLAGRKRQFSIPVRDLMQALETDGFPAEIRLRSVPHCKHRSFCAKTGSNRRGGWAPSKMSTTVVSDTVWQAPGDAKQGDYAARKHWCGSERRDPEEWAHRLTERISGLLKEELAEYGGGEAFLRWSGLTMRMRHEPHLLGHHVIHLSGRTHPTYRQRVENLLVRARQRGDALFTSYLALGEVMAARRNLLIRRRHRPSKRRCARWVYLLPFDAGCGTI